MVVSYLQKSVALIRETAYFESVIVASKELEETFFVILKLDLFYDTQQPLQPTQLQPKRTLESTPSFLN